MIYLIDGNAYLNVAINVVKRMLYTDKTAGKEYYMRDIFNEDRYILKETARIKFRDFSLNYLSSLISPVSDSVNEVHIVFDSKSWRKEYVTSKLKTLSLPSGDFKYKDRKKDNMIYLFFEYFQNEIQSYLEKNSGIVFHRTPGMEGDDIIAQLCENTNKNMIIYTVDKDMFQLVEDSSRFIILAMPKMMSKNKKIFYTKKSDAGDFFSLTETNSVEGTISKFEKRGYVRNEIGPINEIVTKVFTGDKSDNIPRIHKMTPSKVKKVAAYLIEKYDSEILDKLDNYKNDISFIEECAKKVIEVAKIKDSDVILSLNEAICLNIKLMRLSTKMIPSHVKTEEYDKIYKNKVYTKFNYNKLVEIKNNSVLI
jgi:5'-3' exonuclease